VGLAKTGNEIGLNEQEISQLPPEQLRKKLARARERLYKAGAHYVVDTIAEVPQVVEDIEERLRRGDRP